MPPSPPVSVTPESLLIGGRWQPGAAGFDVVDPATLEVIGRAADAGTEEAPPP